MIGKYYPGVRTCRAEPIGYELTKQGKRKTKYKYCTYIPVKGGELELSVWIRKAKEEIYQCGMGELFERVKDHWREYKWLKTEADIEEWSLCSMYYESYLHWPDFTIIWA